MTVECLAYSSSYSAMGVPGTHNGWSTTPNMSLIADYTWMTTNPVTLSGSSQYEFKFAANNGWNRSWGASGAMIYRLPAHLYNVNGSDNIVANLIPDGPYHFVFNELTYEAELLWMGASPLPTPTISSVSLVGTFNDWNLDNLPLAPSDSNPHVWECKVTLEDTTEIKFSINGSTDITNQWGSVGPWTLDVAGTFAINASVAGNSSITLVPHTPTDYTFALNTTNYTATIYAVPSDQAPITSMAVVGGTLINSGATPIGNMTRMAGTVWQSEHYVDSATVSFRFIANPGSTNGSIWGAASSGSTPPPAQDTLTVGSSTLVMVSDCTPGRYRLTFNHSSGMYTFRQLYPTSSGVNLLQNPSFENGSTWSGLMQEIHSSPSSITPHSGSGVGELKAQWTDNDTNYGSFAQDVVIKTGITYRVSGWFRMTSNWDTKALIQLKVEWQDSAGDQVGSSSKTLYDISTSWSFESMEATAPTNATKAHVLFMISNTGKTGALYVDDVEMKVAVSRYQDFESWSSYSTFGDYSPDWAVEDGRTVYNIPPTRPEMGVFISKYIEGTGNNKGIEIFNGTLGEIDLSRYSIQQYNNGATTPSVTIPLSGTLQPDDTYLLTRTIDNTVYQPAVELVQSSSGSSKDLSFNGDDVIVLRCDGQVIDRVGQVGSNASVSLWKTSTTDVTLKRRPTIFWGDKNLTAAFLPAKEWTISDTDDLSGLRAHTVDYFDPTAPYTPGGYSLVINSGGTLTSGILDGGVGNISFWCRAESASPALTYVIETSEDGNDWSELTVLANITTTNYVYYSAYAYEPDHPYLRFRQQDGGTNRLYIDEINVASPESIRRNEDFESWTDGMFVHVGSYSRNGWTINSASISSSNGYFGTYAAKLSTQGSVVSPIFETGVGSVMYWLSNASESPATVLFQVSSDGNNWTTIATNTVSTSLNISSYYYGHGAGCIRLLNISDESEVYVDSIGVEEPVLYRTQNFDSWPTTNYTNSMFQGWTVENGMISGENANSGKGLRFRNQAPYSSVTSPYFPEGIGTISFNYRAWSSSEGGSIAIQVSADGNTWTDLLTQTVSQTTYQNYTRFHSNTNHHYFRIINKTHKRVLIDDIGITAPEPRPTVAIDLYTTPTFPGKDEPVWLNAEIAALNGATINSIVGRYKIGSGKWNTLTMQRGAFDSYQSTTQITGASAGSTVTCMVSVTYAGIGAAENSTGYSTATITNEMAYTISSSTRGTVWINEISYKTGGLWWGNDDQEFVEICGIKDANLGNWTIELCYGDSQNISNGDEVYATYIIPTNTILSDEGDGFGFYVLGDSYFGNAVDQVLTNTVPKEDPYWYPNNNIYNEVGIIRLRDEYKTLVYSISYGGPAYGSTPSGAQVSSDASVSLGGSGGTFSDFSWGSGALTPGAVNTGQTLIAGGSSDELADTWHFPERYITPTRGDPFYMRNPISPEYTEQLAIYAGYPNSVFENSIGTLHYRRQGATAWQNENMALVGGSIDTDNNFYIAASIDSLEFRRGDTIEYVIEMRPSVSGYATTYIGYDSDATSKTFETLAQAQATPFTFTYAITSDIYILNMSIANSTMRLTTTNNDTISAFTNFLIYMTTNLTLSYEDWVTNAFTHTAGPDNSSVDYFDINLMPNDTMKHYRVTPVWP